MARIIIRNIGPIKDVDVELNKINVLMGTQSSGKSTIAKIVSFCQWAEKRFFLDGKFDYDVRESLWEFHRLSENCFAADSFFSYETDFVKIAYTGKNIEPHIQSKNAEKMYRKPKNIYIPSERNFVSVIPNLAKYKETNDNIMNFVYDWFSAKRTYISPKNALSVLNLDVQFYNKMESDNDILVLNSGKEIALREGSSGLQSVIPLVVIVEYLTSYVYNTSFLNSVEEIDALNEFLKKNLDQIIERSVIDEKFAEDDMKKLLTAYQQAKERQGYSKTNLIIEEPEQNLFPATQRDLVNYLLYKMKDARDHSLLLTTHSPYILYAINNCLMGYNVQENISEEEQHKMQSKHSWFNPELVSIWQVKDGALVSVKDKNTQTVTKHYFNEITKSIMDEYYELLSCYEFDK